MRLGAAVVLSFACLLAEQPSAAAEDPLIAALARHAEAFGSKARLLIAQETLLQRSYGYPAHRHLAIGAAAEQMRASYQVHEIISEYSIGPLKGAAPGQLVEARAISTRDGVAVLSTEAARRRLAADLAAGEERARKKTLEELTAMGLADVATDYGTILLAFTPTGLADLALSPVGSAWIGTEKAAVYTWTQERSGGALEFRGRKVARRPMKGRIWLRLTDGMPLRITAGMSHDEGAHALRDDASIDFTMSAAGCVVPASVAHRHWVDGKMLTENLYTYAPFHRFATDTRIDFGAPITPR